LRGHFKIGLTLIFNHIDQKKQNVKLPQYLTLRDNHMYNRDELLQLLQNPESLKKWLDTPTSDSEKKIISIRIELKQLKPIELYIGDNNLKALELLAVLKNHLSIVVNGKDDGYSKRQCLDAIIYALNTPNCTFANKIIKFFNSNFSATQNDIKYLNKKPNLKGHSFILKDDKIIQELLKKSTKTVSEISYDYDENLAQDLKVVSQQLKKNPDNKFLLKEATATAAALRASKRLVTEASDTNRFWKNLNPIAKSLKFSIVPTAILASAGAMTLCIMSLHTKHLIASLNAKLLLGVWPTFGIIVASIFFALLLSDLIVTKTPIMGFTA